VTSAHFGDPLKVIGGDLGPVYIDDVFNIKGIGPKVTINTEECPNALKLKIGDSLIQGNKEAEILGIEKFSKPLSLPIPGGNIGLLLSEKLEPGEAYPNYQ
jgi:translation elongation factor EF-Tu-like GTPase